MYSLSFPIFRDFNQKCPDRASAEELARAVEGKKKNGVIARAAVPNSSFNLYLFFIEIVMR